MRVSFRSVHLKNCRGYDCGIAAAEGEIMRGQETAKKYNDAALEFLGRQEWLRNENAATHGVAYRFPSADFPISCRESDWLLKLGPPLG
jgi:hypothetical protein